MKKETVKIDRMENKELRGLMREVRDLLIEVEKTHRYSMSKIYGLYNIVFEKNETPQSCASCLIRKVNELKAWWYSNAEMPTEEEISDSSDNSREVGNYEEVLPKKKSKNRKEA